MTAKGAVGWDGTIEQIDDYRWRIPRESYDGMRVDGMVYADERLMEQIRTDQALGQVANVAHLPGIVGNSLAMPDIHWGYGFPVGGVAATDPKDAGPYGVEVVIVAAPWLALAAVTTTTTLPATQRVVASTVTSGPAGAGAVSFR